MDTLINLILIVIKILLIIVPVILLVAYYTYFERKIIGYIQVRVGPNRVGPIGLLQPLADGVKMIFKEIVIPAEANKLLFIIAPILAFAPAAAAWAVIPFGERLVLSNINAGVLYILAMTSLGAYGILFAGWASNSKYALYGALRAAAQMVSYEIAMGFALIGVLLAAGTTNLNGIVMAQSGNLFHWYWLPLLPLFAVYWISGVAETNRAPFDVAEGESEIVAGFHVEYSGMMFGTFFIAEYANMLLISTLAAVFFFGGWLSPFQGVPVLGALFSFVPGLIWLGLKTAFFAFLFVWMRATFPRYRYDQIMRLGWKVLIPITLVWIVVVAGLIQYNVGPWFA